MANAVEKAFDLMVLRYFGPIVLERWGGCSGMPAKQARTRSSTHKAAIGTASDSKYGIWVLFNVGWSVDWLLRGGYK